MEPARPSKAFGVAVPYGATLEQLRTQLDPPGPKAWAACLALGYKPEKEALELLVELTKKDWGYRNLALQSLARHPLGAQAETAVLRGLDDSVSQVVRTACETAAKLKL